MSLVLDEMRAVLEGNELYHYGTKFHSGRYPYGSGDDPYQHDGDFLTRVERLKKDGWKETAENVEKEFGMKLEDYRNEKAWANYTRREQQVARAKALKEKGLGDTAIGKEMGIPESTVRSLLNPKSEAKMQAAKQTADFLKEQIAAKEWIDVGKDAERYINRGITCCDSWLESFEAFYNDMGPCPDGYSLDRIDNDLGYSPENCRWASQTTQTQNRGEFNKIFTYNGKTMVLKEWAKELGIKYTTLYQRIYRSGLSFEEAIQNDPFKRQIEINGEKHNLKEWTKIYGIKYQTVVDRINKHKWDIVDAITIPIGTKRSEIKI